MNQYDQFRDDLTVLGALKLETNNTIIKMFADFNQYLVIASCRHF